MLNVAKPAILMIVFALVVVAQQDGSPDLSASNKSHPSIFKADMREITLSSRQAKELKYHMAQGNGLVYSWKSNGPVQFEFHGEPDVRPDARYSERYAIDEKAGVTESHGSFTAPSTGIHGWYWYNIGEQDVTIRVNAAGFFDKVQVFTRAGVQDFPALDAK
jgi:hypothetical protein